MAKSIAIVYSKDASSAHSGMDLIRWIEMGACLRDLDHDVHLVTDRPNGVRAIAGIPVVDSQDADWNGYEARRAASERLQCRLPSHSVQR